MTILYFQFNRWNVQIGYEQVMKRKARSSFLWSSIVASGLSCELNALDDELKKGKRGYKTLNTHFRKSFIWMTLPFFFWTKSANEPTKRKRPWKVPSLQSRKQFVSKLHSNRVCASKISQHKKTRSIMTWSISVRVVGVRKSYVSMNRCKYRKRPVNKT